MPKTSVKKH